MATLWCEPPWRNHTPSAALSTVTSMVARAIGDGTATAAPLIRTSLTLRSRAGKPPMDWVIRPGNLTPPWSWYSP